MKLAGSLFSRLALVMVALAAAGPVALGWWVVDANAAALLREANHAHQLTAEAAAAEVRAGLDQVKAELEAVGWAVLAPDLGEDAARLGAVRALVATSHLGPVALYGPSGQRLWTVRGPGEEAALPDVLPEPLRAERLHALGTGEVRGTPAAPRLEVVLPLGEDAPRAWLVTLLDLQPFARRLAHLAERPPLSNAEAVLVVDAQGRQVLGADLGAVAARRPLPAGERATLAQAPGFRAAVTFTTEYREGDRAMLGAVAVLPEPGWAAVVRQPRETAFASLAALQRAVAAAVVVAVLLGILGAVAMARRLTGPVRALGQATRELAERRFERVDPAVSAREDELGELGRSFDAMAVSLRQAEQRLVDEGARRAALSRYLSPGVVEEVLKNPAALPVAGERREVTVLFADVVGFTGLAQSLPPEHVVTLLNELFTLATDIVERHGGIIDKFIGDCVMAVWGAPHGQPDDAARAVRAAEELRRWVESANAAWRTRWNVEVRLGIGVHTGLAVAGNVGSARRLDYTVIGDTVNVAARLEAMAMPGQILLSADTYRALGGSLGTLPPFGERVLRGRSEPTQLHEVPW